MQNCDKQVVAFPANLLRKRFYSQIVINLKEVGFFHLFFVVIILSGLIKIYVGDLAVSPFNPLRWKLIFSLGLIFTVFIFFLDFISSFLNLKKFRDPYTGDIPVIKLWRNVLTNPIEGFLVIVLMAYGVSSAGGLAEFYKINTNVWYDSYLWGVESRLFNFLRDSFGGTIALCDFIYFFFWNYVILIYCILYRLKMYTDFAVANIATVICFVMARWIAVKFPTAGPVFYKPEFFNLTGTLSEKTQQALLLYMQGGFGQNGFTPGTMGMPSLHIAISFLATWFLVRNLKWTAWIVVPCFCMIWFSTIMLGWHYILDGVGGVIITLVAVYSAQKILIFSSVPYRLRLKRKSN